MIYWFVAIATTASIRSRSAKFQYRSIMSMVISIKFVSHIGYGCQHKKEILVSFNCYFIARYIILIPIYYICEILYQHKSTDVISNMIWYMPTKSSFYLYVKLFYQFRRKDVCLFMADAVLRVCPLATKTEFLKSVYPFNKYKDSRPTQTPWWRNKS